MSDLISRQAAIDYINHVLTDWSEYKETAIDCLRNLPSAEPEQTCEYWDSESKFCALCRPSAQPERKKGRWIEDAESFYKAVNEKGGGVDENTPYFTDDIACSECLAKFSVIDNETERFDFCPNCGAEMRGGEDDKV